MYVLSGQLIDVDVTLLIQVVVFFLAFFILKSLVFRPILRVIEARETAIDGRRQQAREMERDANDKGQRFEEAMRNLRVTAAEERERLRQDGVRLEKTILDNVRADTQRQLDDAERDLEGEARAVRRDMETSIPALARDIAGHMLGREVQ